MPEVNYFTTYYENCGLVGIKSPPFDEIERMVRKIGTERIGAVRLYKRYEEDSIEETLLIFGKK